MPAGEALASQCETACSSSIDVKDAAIENSEERKMSCQRRGHRPGWGLQVLSALLLAMYRHGPSPLHRLARWAWGGYVGPTLRVAQGRREPPVIAQAVVLRDAEVLLSMRESPRLWELPGGYVEPGEPVDDAAVREVEEETGIRVQVVRQIGWYERTGFRPHRSPAFLCRPVGGSITGSHEVVVSRYFPVTRLPLNMFPWHRRVIWDALTMPARPLRRVQHLGAGTVLLSILLHLAHWLAHPSLQDWRRRKALPPR